MDQQHPAGLGHVHEGAQEAQRAALEKVATAPGDPRLLAANLARRRAMLGVLGAVTFQATTAGPLTLHLSRASVLENAGICLHPVYGFVFLPGSGIKGMARAYAETMWRPKQKDLAVADARIQAVFGTAPGGAAGAVVFHDAWPVAWPGLLVDITNCHHPDYYGGVGEPGDWEDPVPVYFLAVQPGTAFEFALSARPGSDVALLKSAQRWLIAALVHLGASAKTNAGYGAFLPPEGVDVHVPSKKARDQVGIPIDLVTPAFLAGAGQRREDCALRPAALRGQLRWWWRAMHAGYLSSDDLRALEARVWGSSRMGGPVAVRVEPVGTMDVKPFNKRSFDVPNDEKIGERGVPDARDPRKVTPGLWFLTYGMDEKKGRREMVLPGARWKVTFMARPSREEGRPELTAGTLLNQALAAAWLLCRYGGVGAKGRKGFGSLGDFDFEVGEQPLALDTCRAQAATFRKAAGLIERPVPRPMSAVLDTGIFKEWVFPSGVETVDVLQQVGFAVQTFAKKYAHDVRKKGLGLPRNVRGHGSFRDPPVRHAAPFHLHIARSGGGFAVRFAAFPVDREYGIGRGRIDLLLRWPWLGASGARHEQREALELKVWAAGRPDPLAEGLGQLDGYLERLGLGGGTLVIFDRRPSARPLFERTRFEDAMTPTGRHVRVLRG